MAVQVTINGVDKTKSIEFGSLKIKNIITRKRDLCNFIIKSYIGDVFTPAVGREVVITDGGVKIFAGVITELENTSRSFKIIRWKIKCQDYTRLLDQKLVADTFESQTVDAIIASLQSDYFPAGFTINNVDAPVLVNSIKFNYKPLIKCIEELADLINYDYYIDFNKDLHFFAKEKNAAPFDIQDDNGSYRHNTLVIRRDNSQIANSVVVRGGEYLGETFSSDIECNGVDFVFPLPYKFSEFKATLTGNVLNVGTDFLSDPNDFDALHGFQEKVIRFKSTDTPSNGALLVVSGKPNLPVITKVKNQPAIDAMVSAEGGDGLYEKLIIDKSIRTKAGARQRATGELVTYAETISDGEFETETSGLFAGQEILVNSASRGVNEKFIINRVTITQFSNDTFVYKVSLISTKSLDLIDILQKLLLAESKKLEINEDETIDLVEGYDEQMTIEDAVEFSLEHNLQTETIVIGETFTAQSLDFPTVFVLGPFIPSAAKRVFLLSASHLS